MFSARATQDKTGTKHATLLSEGCELQGDLMLNCNMQIDGRLQGSIRSVHAVTISQPGRVQGKVYARHLIIKGCAEGEFYAEQVEILQSGILSGTIYSDNLSIEPGGRFIGEVQAADNSRKTGSNKSVLPLRDARGKVLSMTSAPQGAN